MWLSKFLLETFFPRKIVQDEPRRLVHMKDCFFSNLAFKILAVAKNGLIFSARKIKMHHLPARIYGLFCGNKKYFPPQKNPTGLTSELVVKKPTFMPINRTAAIGTHERQLFNKLLW